MHCVAWVKEVRQNGTVRLEAEMRDPGDNGAVCASASAVWFCRPVREGTVPTSLGLGTRPDYPPSPFSIASPEGTAMVRAELKKWAAAKAEAGGWSIPVPVPAPREAAAAVYVVAFTVIPPRPGGVWA